MTKAFAYLRVSGKGQIDGDGFPRQREAIKCYAAANDIKIVRWFEEKGVSGTAGLKDGVDQAWEQRPAYLEMLKAIVENGVRTVVVEKMDRLARDYFVQEYIYRHLKNLKPAPVKLYSAVEGDLDNVDTDPTRKLMRGIMGNIADYDRAMITMKLRAARNRMRATTGRCEGAKPFGELSGEAEVIARIQQMRSEGMGVDRIADQLNEEGVGPRRGARWYGSSVNNVLKRAG